MSGPSQQTPPQAALRKLPVMDTVAATYRRFFQRLIYLPRALALPLLANAILVMAGPFAVAQPALTDPGAMPPPAALLTFLAVWLLMHAVLTVFAVAWQRVALLGAAARPLWIPGWGRREWRTFGYFLATYAIVFLGVFAVATLMAVLTGVIQHTPGLATAMQDQGPAAAMLVWLLQVALLIVLVLIPLLRVSFVFPAVAVDENYGLRLAWRHTKGQGLRLSAAVVLVVLPLLVASLLLWGVFALLVGVPLAGMGGDIAAVSYLSAATVVAGLVGFVFGFVCYAVFFTFFAVAFETTTGWIPHPPNVGEEDAGFDTPA